MRGGTAQTRTSLRHKREICDYILVRGLGRAWAFRLSKIVKHGGGERGGWFSKWEFVPDAGTFMRTRCVQDRMGGP